MGRFRYSVSFRLRHVFGPPEVKQRLNSADVPQALAGIRLKALFQQRTQFERSGAQIGLIADHGGKRIGDLFTHEEHLARDHFIKHHAERPNVGTLIHALAASLLGAM